MKKQTKEKIINKLENPNILSYLIISIIVVAFYFLCLLPVFFDFQNFILFWKIAMIIGSSIFAIVFLFIIIVGLKLIKKAKKETDQEQIEENKGYIKVFIAFIIVTLAIFIYSCLHYFNNTLWGADLTINGLFFIAICLIAIFLIVEQFFGDAFNNEVKPMVLLSVAVLSLLFAFIFELSNTNIQYSFVLYKISIGIFYLVVTALLVHKIIYNKEEFEKINKNKKIGKIISFVFWSSLLLITFPFYINWWGLQGEDFKTFVSVYSAIVGGGLTLLGVAWTIRKGVEDRKKDREQLEKDRKEEERKKAMPYLQFFAKHDNDMQSISAGGVSIKYNEDIIDPVPKTLCFKNISDTIFILDHFIIGNKIYKLEKKIVGKNQYFVLNLEYDRKQSTLAEIMEKMYIVGRDVLDNYYSYRVIKSNSINTNIYTELPKLLDKTDLEKKTNE